MSRTSMLLLALYFALSTLAVQCRGSQHSSCAAGQCKVVRGVEVCTRCRAGHVLVNGVCTGNSAGYEADSNCQVEHCDRCVSGDDTKCEACSAGFDLDDNTKQCAQKPASNCQVEHCDRCVSGDDTKCEACSAGFDLDDNTKQCAQKPASNCQVEHCDRCVSGDDTKCEACSAGFDLDDNTKQCAQKPASNCQVEHCDRCVSGDDTKCEACSAGFDLDDNTKQCASSSINKSSGGLSTGAIAGIAVAVVIVVGGLIGFLCWWFLCRGKA